MTNYENAVIYKLSSDIDDSTYIGSTAHPLTRFSMHVSASKEQRNINRPLYIWARTIGWHHIKMDIVEDYECEDGIQLAKRERFYIDYLQPDLNSHIPGQTEDELVQSRKDSQLKFSMTQKYKDYQILVKTRRSALKNKIKLV